MQKKHPIAAHRMADKTNSPRLLHFICVCCLWGLLRLLLNRHRKSCSRTFRTDNRVRPSQVPSLSRSFRATRTTTCRSSWYRTPFNASRTNFTKLSTSGPFAGEERNEAPNLRFPGALLQPRKSTIGRLRKKSMDTYSRWVRSKTGPLVAVPVFRRTKARTCSIRSRAGLKLPPRNHRLLGRGTGAPGIMMCMAGS